MSSSISSGSGSGKGVSAQTIARWNALVSEERRVPKRPHDHEEMDDQGDNDEGDDDDVSMISRSPTPDVMDIDKYDEYLKGITPHEVITAETKIKSTNKGFAMLSRLGWTEGQPLGLAGDGRVEPVPFRIKHDSTGLGKLTQDYTVIESTVSQRRGLDSERQQKESEEQRRNREDTVARRTALATEISTTLKPFFCALCDKQFQNVAQYDEHTNSYAHHHKARMRDMQTNSRAIIAKEDLDKRKEKERKREEKELRKLAKAQGVKIAKSALPPQQVPSVPPMEDVGQPQKEAAAPIIADSPSNRSGSMQPSWSTAASSSLTPPLPPQPPADPPPPSEPFQPPPPPPRPPSPESVPPSAEPSKTTSDSTASSPPPPPPPPPRTPPPRPPSKQAGASDVEPVRSSWQTFQKSRFRR